MDTLACTSTHLCAQIKYQHGKPKQNNQKLAQKAEKEVGF